MNDKKIVKDFYETVVTNAQLDRIQEFISPDCVVCMGRETFPMGVADMSEHLIATKKTYPDYSMKSIRQYQDGETAFSEFFMTGTHEGEWIGITSTHKRLRFYGFDVDKVRGGKIIEHGGAVNTFETLFEAGLIKPV